MEIEEGKNQKCGCLKCINRIRHPMYSLEYIKKEKELENDFTEKYQQRIDKIFKERQENFNYEIDRQRNKLLAILGIVTVIGFIIKYVF